MELNKVIFAYLIDLFRNEALNSKDNFKSIITLIKSLLVQYKTIHSEEQIVFTVSAHWHLQMEPSDF
jgi:hypothetical protein